MSRNKKKNQVTLPEVNLTQFEIPQISKPPANIKTKETKIQITPAFSAIWGRVNFDEECIPPTSPLPVGRSYDAFRKPEDRLTPDDDREWESLTIRNSDRTKIFPNAKPLPNIKAEENKPIIETYEEPKKKTITKVEKKYEEIKEEKEELLEPVINDNNFSDIDLDDSEIFNDPVYINFEEEDNKDEDDILGQIADLSEDFKPVNVDEVEFYEEETHKQPLEFKPIEEAKVESFKEEPVKQAPIEKHVEKPNKPKKNNYKSYKLPPISLFKEIETDNNIVHEWIQDQMDIINRTLAEFNIDGQVVNFTKGPSVTRYEISLAPGVSVKSVTKITENLKMNLAALSLHIEAPIPGKTYVGVEVPNKVVDTVNFGNICHSQEFKNSSKLSFGVGIDLNGNTVVAPINKMPHGLIAGTTGSGKSVCSHSLIISLLLKNKPDELKLLLVDPKSVEFVFYEDLPHLVTPIISDPKLASQALKWACDEMDNRYKLFSQLKVRNIEDYNSRIEADYPDEPKMAYMLILIDELADLMQTASADVEQSIQRITQKARAAGIHLIVATQRPTTDVVKGTIKANIPTRIAFRVSSPTDSMTILDYGGAEQLLGKGDMFFKNDFGTTRIQGAFIKDEEINAVCDYIRQQAGPDYIFNHDSLSKSAEMQARKESTDELFNDVALYVVEMQNASINNLQKRFNVGFNRAQALIDLLESAGIVTPQVPGKARTVLIKSVEELEEILN